MNKKKTKIICVFVSLIPDCLRHVQRVSRDDSHAYLGLPFMEGEENAEISRRICIKFIKKARVLQLVELSLLGQVIAVNHILTSTLWYFIFSWVPSEVDFKRF